MLLWREFGLGIAAGAVLATVGVVAYEAPQLRECGQPGHVSETTFEVQPTLRGDRSTDPAVPPTARLIETSGEQNWLEVRDPREAEGFWLYRAARLLPDVARQQRDRLRDLRSDHAAATLAFSFHVARHGEFLDLRVTRLDPEHPEGSLEQVTSVNLTVAQPITLREGHPPDLEGDDRFYVQGVDGYALLRFDGVTFAYAGLPPLVSEETALRVGQSSASSSGSVEFTIYDHFLSLPLTAKVARPAEDDVVTFGTGNDAPQAQTLVLGPSNEYGSGAVLQPPQFPPPPARRTSSFSLRVPAGQGRAVYDEILAAIGGGH